ncbi:carbon-nitrogen hydrolase family protein [Nocardia sp. NBC_01503]|uniref:carbon-nitrogen hydrolase family protein n=1 Tax=Nocardia sp. NBC_01503 TaxID=2975997 RepID=UPI003FA52DE3
MVTTPEPGSSGATTVTVHEPEPQPQPITGAADAGVVDIAVVQFAPGTDTVANLTALRAEVRAAAELGARLVIAPEYSMYSVLRLDAGAVAAAEPLTGAFVNGLRGIAAEFGVYLVAGVLETPGGDQPEGLIYNTLVAATPDAEFAAIYRKVHLYDAFKSRESDVILPGPLDQTPTFTVDGIVFGMQTCFDLRFPEGIRRIAAAGAHALILPAQWIPGPGKVDQWTTLLRARAIENTIYVAAADQAAPRGSGASMIIAPTGAVLAELGDQPGIATARIDLEHLAEVRTTNPSLALRRFTIRGE